TPSVLLIGASNITAIVSCVQQPAIHPTTSGCVHFASAPRASLGVPMDRSTLQSPNLLEVLRRLAELRILLVDEAAHLLRQLRVVFVTCARRGRKAELAALAGGPRRQRSDARLAPLHASPLAVLFTDHEQRRHAVGG